MGMECTTRWGFIGRKIIPILDVMGESNYDIAQVMMIDQAIKMVELAEKYKGVPYNNQEKMPKQEMKLRISFSLIFPSSEAMNECYRSIKETIL